MNAVLSKQIPGVKYLFPYVSDAGSILIDINLEDEAPLDVTIYYENSEITDKYQIGRSRNILIDSRMFRENRKEDGAPTCQDAKEVCNIVIDITARDNNEEYIQDGINIEVSIKSKDTVPVYVR